MLLKVQQTFAQVFNIDESLIDENVTMDNLDEWDSMRHMELVTALEKAFNIKFKMNEIINLNSVKAILAIIKERQS